MTEDEIIEVVTAKRDNPGAVVQWRNSGTDAPWNSCVGNKPFWAFHKYDYRIKPEPPKPRICNAVCPFRGNAIELTPEVRKACEAAGIETGGEG